MSRRRMPKRRDRKVFKQTANKTQVINLKPVVMRGGIRL